MNIDIPLTEENVKRLFEILDSLAETNPGLPEQYGWVRLQDFEASLTAFSEAAKAKPPSGLFVEREDDLHTA